MFTLVLRTFFSVGFVAFTYPFSRAKLSRLLAIIYLVGYHCVCNCITGLREPLFRCNVHCLLFTRVDLLFANKVSPNMQFDVAITARLSNPKGRTFAQPRSSVNKKNVVVFTMMRELSSSRVVQY